ncbi:MAG: hypothetical protein ACREX0_00605 [Noviherbaspirillum sp.]
MEIAADWELDVPAEKSYIMKTLLTATVGYLVVCPACAQAGSDDGSDGAYFAMPLFSFEQAERAEASEASVSHKLDASGRNTVFGYVGLPGEPAWGPTASLIPRYGGIDSPNAMRASHWLDSTQSVPRVVTVGYSWRDVKVEGSAFSAPVEEVRNPIRNEPPKLDSRSARLSFNSGQNWAFQISRGSVMGLDQLVPDGEVRRTTISASYNHLFSGGTWQTTLGWGRNAKKFRETTTGYLFESMFRFGGRHAMFGRVEQVGSDEVLREDESLQRHFFNMNKLTVGYFHEFKPAGPVKADVGVMMSRHFVPSAMSPSYGEGPTAYMMFVRLKLQ